MFERGLLRMSHHSLLNHQPDANGKTLPQRSVRPSRSASEAIPNTFSSCTSSRQNDDPNGRAIDNAKKCQDARVPQLSVRHSGSALRRPSEAIPNTFSSCTSSRQNDDPNCRAIDNAKKCQDARVPQLSVRHSGSALRRPSEAIPEHLLMDQFTRSKKIFPAIMIRSSC
jgi:hypothetical protein